ncbi:aminotransferase class I/II-fold pyridoxal phosphate-dependent enzyme [Cellulomonas sp. HD19AZ1]|nr:aminotransferase class I/II-fold pyridoxal phosphate-dependent enzyme [Cellulomonas sp. HD19AZ1]
MFSDVMAQGPTRQGAPREDVTDLLLTDVQGLPPRALTELLVSRITDGSLPPGTRLPTIKDLAAASGASTSSIAAVWARLVEKGLVRTRRRGGTVVVGADAWPQAAAPREFDGWASVDLTSAHPAAEDLPDLRRAFELSLAEPRTHSLAREHITDLLRTAVEGEWPFPAQEWSTVSGSGEAALLTCEAATPPGGTVAVQEPTTPGTVANLRSLGYRVVPVTSDERGPEPGSLAAALAAGATTFLLQPEGTLTVDSVLDPHRAAELADVLRTRAPHAWVVEEDVLGTLHPGGTHTLGTLLPDRVVRLASYCRAFGLDLRTTVVGGARELVERIRLLRSHGILAQSRILQNALAHMLLDPAARAFADAAARDYLTTAQNLVAALADLGTDAVVSPGGLLVWLPAHDEAQALAELSGHGITLVASGRTFVGAPARPLLRVASPQLPADAHLAELARLLADAARSQVAAT